MTLAKTVLFYLLDVSPATTVASFSKDKQCKCLTASCLLLDIDPIYPKSAYAPRRDCDLVFKRDVKLESNKYALLKVDRETEITQPSEVFNNHFK